MCDHIKLSLIITVVAKFYWLL